MSTRRSDKLFLEGISSLKLKDFKLAEGKFKEMVIKRTPKCEKAAIIYQALLIRKECDNLIRELKHRF
ncbi:MAG: hypothetical protein OEV55_01170 [candidate division Zixibacteria bacterium]|nr:hypothetical protein [candidate division Zixibacteria bacterium]